MGKNDLPKVSIIIPVYNGTNYMREAINSALSQSYSNIEVIIINDGSTDQGRTEKMALSYGNRIRYFYKENGGVATALNLGIEKMTGEYFSWLSHDDVYEPDKIEKQIDAILSNNYPVVAVCDVNVISELGKIIKTNKISHRFGYSVPCFLSFDIETGLNGCSLLIPKILFDKYGLFNPDLKCTQDYDMWFRIARDVPFVYVRENLVLSRQHEEQDSKTKTDLCTIEADQLHSRFISELAIDDIERYGEGDIGYYKNIYKVYFNSGYKKTAARILNIMLHICYMKGDIKEAISLLNSEVVGEAKEQYVKEIWENVIVKHLADTSGKPHLLFYSNVWVRGGIERVLSIVMNELKNKYRITLVSNFCDNKDCFSLPEGVSHILLNSNLETKLPYSLMSLSILLDVDIFVGNPNIISSFLDVYPLLKNVGIKTIAINHGYYFLPYAYSWLHPIISKRNNIYQDVSAVTWPTTYSTFIYSCISKNGVLLPNPSTFEISESNIISKKDKIILCVGRFYDSIKRLDRVLKVFRKVLDYDPDVKLCLVGGYDLNLRIPSESNTTISELLDQLKFPEGSIIWEGEKPNVEEYYKKSSVLIMTSDSEGFGMVLVEACCFGLPCVIFKINGLEDIITDGENGFIIEQGDIDGMAEKIHVLLNDDALCIKMGQRSKSLVQRFSRKEICSRWESLIDILLKTDDQDTINMELAHNFIPPINDYDKFLCNVVQEYEKNVSVLVQSQNTTNIIKIESNTVNVNKICNNCIIEMQNTLSWRITKPLRWTKALYRSLKNNGIRITTIKIINKVKNKLKIKR